MRCSTVRDGNGLTPSENQRPQRDETRGASKSDDGWPAVCSGAGMCPPDDSARTVDRLKSLLDELNEATTEAFHLHEAVDATVSQTLADHAVDAAARSHAAQVSEDPYSTKAGK
jgi:hypothetical protein